MTARTGRHARGGSRPRLDRRRVSRAIAGWFVNPIYYRLAGRRWFTPHALLETRGRHSGQPRRVAVGNGLEGDRFWIVAEYGRHAHYVRNIEAEPRVRVKVAGRWYEGTATVLPEEDPRAVQRRLGRPVVAAAVRAFGTDLLTVRIDLDRGTSSASRRQPGP